MNTAPKPNNTMTDAEWHARLQLAACYRIFDMLGWDEMIYNHVTVKVPNEDDAFLINPYGLHYSEICASNLVKINLDGEKLDNSTHSVNLAGLTQHSVFHKHNPNAHAIIHTHTTETTAVCSLEDGLQPISFYATLLTGNIGYHDFEGITIRGEEGERLIKNMGSNCVLMLKNHGPVVVGKTLPEAFILNWILQRACEIQIATLSMGKPVMISDSVIEVHQRDTSKMLGKEDFGKLEFEAMVRQVDKIDASWRR